MCSLPTQYKILKKSETRDKTQNETIVNVALYPFIWSKYISMHIKNQEKLQIDHKYYYGFINFCSYKEKCWRMVESQLEKLSKRL